MEIKFDVFWTKNLGTLYKDNSIDTNGIEATTSLDLSQVNYMHVNFLVDGAGITDAVEIVGDRLIIPFKNSVFKAGLNKFELVATMKNGDVLPSQTYTYNIEKSLENDNSVEAETNYPILINLIEEVKGLGAGGGSNHSHSNKLVLDTITQSNIDKWNSGTVDTTNFYNKTEVDTKDSLLDNKITVLSDEVNSVKQSVSNGKTLIASAITDKGIGTSNTDTFEVMANNIKNISTSENNIDLYKIVNGTKYRLVMNEDFRNGSLNKNMWVDRYLNTWTTKEYLSKANYYIKDDILNLVIDKDSDAWNPNHDSDLRVTGIQTAEKDGLHKTTPIYRNVKNFFGFIAKYGYFECRAKVFKGSGSHCAWWMIGMQNTPSEKYEVDIFEILGKNTNAIQTVTHAWGGSEQEVPGKIYNAGVDLSLDFHTYGFEWKENEMIFYFDGAEYHRGSVALAYPLITILSAYETRSSNWTGEYDPNIPYPKEFKVDYFRAYKKASSEVSKPVITSQVPSNIDVTGGNYTLDINTNTIKELPKYVSMLWNDGAITEHWVEWNPATEKDKQNLTNGVSFEWFGKINGLEIEASCYITNTSVSVVGVSLSETVIDVGIDSIYTLNAVINPSNATNQNVSWKIADNSIASISSNNLSCIITGIKAGNTSVEVRTEDGNYIATVDVNVINESTDDYNFVDNSMVLLVAKGTPSGTTLWGNRASSGGSATLINFDSSSGFDGSSLKFDNVNDYVDISSLMSNVDFSQDFTITTSFNITELKTYGVIFNFSPNGSGQDSVYLQSQSAYLKFGAKNGWVSVFDVSLATSSSILNKNTIISIVKKGTIINCYINDTLVTKEITTMPVVVNRIKSYVGIESSTSTQHTFNGKINSFIIYQRALSDNELSQNKAELSKLF